MSPLQDSSLGPRRARTRPHLVAIVGGSGSGKSWLADKLYAAFVPEAARLSLDDFYRDRSHLSPARRANLNFDHPRAIDWHCLERVLGKLLAGHPAKIPHYDFATHCRRPSLKTIRPKSLIIVEGLWLLRRPSIRRLFMVTIYLDCPTRLRLRRRLERDRLSRGRTQASVRKQFWRTVQPMHIRYVAPQSRWANTVLRKPYTAKGLRAIEAHLRSLLASAVSVGTITR